MKMFTHKYRYLFIVLLATYSYINTLFSEVYHYYGISAPWYYVLLCFILITGLVWEGNRIIQKIAQPYFLKLTKMRFLVLTFFIGLAFSAIISLALGFIGTRLLHLSAQESPIAIKLAFTYGTRINLFLHIINGILVFIREYKSKQLEAEELKRISTQAQLQSIKNQVNPHFLFNNLNVLSGMVIKDNPDANKFIEEFAKVYRYILNSQDKELIPLQTELDYIKPYIFLLQKRFPESISIDLSIPDKYYSYYIVPAALQMLIENAIKHNIVSKARPLQINLSANGREVLTVKNNLQPKQLPENSSQIGLKNISQRYELITGKNIEVKKDENSFSVVIPLIQTGV
jgi:two-component system, LytTR family, sensor kinase